MNEALSAFSEVVDSDSIPRVVHIKDNAEGAVYIGRRGRGHKQSVFANPFKIGRDGDRATVIARYVDYLFDGGHLEPGARALWYLPRFRNSPAFACFCRHDGAPITTRTICHGDVLRYLLQNFSNEELESLATRTTQLAVADRPTVELIIKTVVELVAA